MCNPQGPSEGPVGVSTAGEGHPEGRRRCGQRPKIRTLGVWLGKSEFLCLIEGRRPGMGRAGESPGPLVPILYLCFAFFVSALCPRKLTSVVPSIRDSLALRFPVGTDQ